LDYLPKSGKPAFPGSDGPKASPKPQTSMPGKSNRQIGQSNNLKKLGHSIDIWTIPASGIAAFSPLEQIFTCKYIKTILYEIIFALNQALSFHCIKN